MAGRWDDLDLERGTLPVRCTTSRGVEGEWVAGEPKKSKSRRLIVLPDSVLASLRRQEAAGSLIGPVFLGPRGGPLQVNRLIAEFHRLIAKANVPKLRFHNLRHSCATLSLAAGVHPKLVAELPGHSSTQMTMDRYSHVTQTLARTPTNLLDEALLAPRPELRVPSASPVPDSGEQVAS